jgi:hypothetical protein
MSLFINDLPESDLSASGAGDWESPSGSLSVEIRYRVINVRRRGLSGVRWMAGGAGERFRRKVQTIRYYAGLEDFPFWNR